MKLKLLNVVIVLFCICACLCAFVIGAVTMVHWAVKMIAPYCAMVADFTAHNWRGCLVISGLILLASLAYDMERLKEEQRKRGEENIRHVRHLEAIDRQEAELHENGICRHCSPPIPAEELQRYATQKAFRLHRVAGRSARPN